jgi:ElaB/YqjD/DUF883 family membrane-anchored ribosome-binding protein
MRMTEKLDRMVDKGVSGADQVKLQAADALEEAARRLRNKDLSVHGEDMKQILHDVEHRVNELREEAGARFQEFEACYHERMEPVETIISEHPIPAVLVAMGVGFLVGMLISRAND